MLVKKINNISIGNKLLRYFKNDNIISLIDVKKVEHQDIYIITESWKLIYK